MAGNPLNDPNWASDLADTVVRIVGTVRDKTTSNIVMAARAIVYGLLGGIIGLFLLVVAIVAVFRGVQSLLDLAVSWPRAVYLSYFIVGGIMCLAGMLMMRKRRPRTA